MPLSLLILALSAFAIGTTEFVIMGLLPNVAADLGVSIPGAGWLVTGYALGVAIGAPFMALATAKLPRKAAGTGNRHTEVSRHVGQQAHDDELGGADGEGAQGQDE